MSSYGEDEEGELNPNFNCLYTLQRDKDYINSLYIIKKIISIDKNVEKIYGITKEKNYNVIITKVSNISFQNNQNVERRLALTTQLIEENSILVENLWIEETTIDKFILYLSEFTKSTYRNEYNLISLNHYLNENHSENSYKSNIIILLQILQKINELHSKSKFAHLNLCPNNIYINKNNQNIYFGPPKIFEFLNSDYSCLWYSSPEECYIEKHIEEDLISGINNDIWSIGCILCEMFFIVSPLFQSFSKREKMKKIIEILGVPKFEEIDYMSNQEYSFIQSTEENFKNNNQLKDILLSEQQEINFTSVNNTIKKIIFEIIYKCFYYNRNKRISIDEMINQLDYLYDRYIKEKPTKIDAMNIINRDNLMQLNAPIINGALNINKLKKNLNNQNAYNNRGSYLVPFSGNNNQYYNNDNNNELNMSKDDDNDNNDNIINISSSQNQKNYDSFISGRYSSVMGNNNEIDDKIQTINNKYNSNNNRNFSKFCSLSSISSNKNYNKAYLTSITTNNGNNNHNNYNYNNITEKFTDGNSNKNNKDNNDDQIMYTPTEIIQKNEQNEDPEYAKLQNRKYIYIFNYFFLLSIELDDMVNYINNMNAL